MNGLSLVEENIVFQIFSYSIYESTGRQCEKYVRINTLKYFRTNTRVKVPLNTSSLEVR